MKEPPHPSNAVAENARRSQTIAAWLGVVEPEIEKPDDRVFVALDARACAHWRLATWAEAWAATCLHSRLDPDALLGMRGNLLSELDLAAVARSHVGDDPLALLLNQIALMENLEIVKKAILAGYLPALPLSDEERRPSRVTDLMRRVWLEDFAIWADFVGLRRTAPWPPRRTESGDVGQGPRQEEWLQLPVRSHEQWLVKRVEAQFSARYARGRLATPTEEEVDRFLREELHEPKNYERACRIAAILRPDNTANGPRTRWEDEPA